MGSWHEASGDVSNDSPWGGLKKYRDWPSPLGCFPCETGMPALHIAKEWSPMGLVMLAAEDVAAPERAVVAQLAL